jgi:hypothetical protein
MAPPASLPDPDRQPLRTCSPPLSLARFQDGVTVLPRSSLEAVEGRKRVDGGDSLPHLGHASCSPSCSRCRFGMQEQVTAEWVQGQGVARRRDTAPDVADRAGPREWPEDGRPAWRQCGRLQPSQGRLLPPSERA